MNYNTSDNIISPNLSEILGIGLLNLIMNLRIPSRQNDITNNLYKYQLYHLTNRQIIPLIFVFTKDPRNSKRKLINKRKKIKCTIFAAFCDYLHLNPI